MAISINFLVLKNHGGKKKINLVLLSLVRFSIMLCKMPYALDLAIDGVKANYLDVISYTLCVCVCC